MFACCHYYFRLPSSLISIHTTCISLSLRRTSAPIHLTSVLGVLGTQETSCILIAGLLERGIFDLYFPEFDKPWVIHLRETCCCSTNLCTWRPNTVYKSQAIFWRRCRSICRHQSCIWLLIEGLPERQKPEPPLGNHCMRERRISEFKAVVRFYLKHFLGVADACYGYNHKYVFILVG